MSDEETETETGFSTSEETETTEETNSLVNTTDVSSSSEELLTPEECAARTGNTFVLKEAARLHLRTKSTVGYSPRHLAAAQLHGWNAHKRATSKSFLLTLSAYQKALKAVSKLTPYEGALSEYAPKTVK